MSEQNAPFTTLGKHLKYVREQSHETLIEVSGAVEIDVEVLERIEAGKERPAEDVLMLLINHFNVQDQEAVQLWELAGYEGDAPDQFKPAADFAGHAKPVVMLLTSDNRAHYSDGLEVMANNAGLVLNFTQASGIDQNTSVAKVGMSYEQAEHVLKTLQQNLLKAKYLKDPRALPPSTLFSDPSENQ